MYTTLKIFEIWRIFLSNDNVGLGKLNKETFWTFPTTLTLSYSIILPASLNSVNTYFKRAHNTQHHESKRRLHSSAHFTYLWAWLPRHCQCLSIFTRLWDARCFLPVIHCKPLDSISSPWNSSRIGFPWRCSSCVIVCTTWSRV